MRPCVVVGFFLLCFSLANNKAARSRSLLVPPQPLLSLIHGDDGDLEAWRRPVDGSYAGTFWPDPWRCVSSATLAPLALPPFSFFGRLVLVPASGAGPCSDALPSHSPWWRGLVGYRSGAYSCNKLDVPDLLHGRRALRSSLILGATVEVGKEPRGCGEPRGGSEASTRSPWTAAGGAMEVAAYQVVSSPVTSRLVPSERWIWTRLHFSISFGGPPCKSQGLMCNFLFLWSPTCMMYCATA